MPDGLLPPVDAVIPCAMHASDVPLRVDVLGIVRLDFKGGIKYRVEAERSSGLGARSLQVIGFELGADSAVLGRVTMTQAESDATPLSVLEVVETEPPKLRQTTFLDFTLVIEKPPGGGPPQVLSNTKTATLLNDKLSVFPPSGAVYQLQAPVDLAPVGSPSQVVAQLQQLAVTASHNP